MSTILNALKKLEQENKTNKKRDDFQPTQEFSDRRSFGYASWRDRLRNFNFRWTWAAIAIIGVGIGFFLAGLDSKPTRQAIVSPSEKFAKARQPTRPSATPPRVKTRPAASPEQDFLNQQTEATPSSLKPLDNNDGESEPPQVPQKPVESDASNIAMNDYGNRAPSTPSSGSQATSKRKETVSPAPDETKAADPPDKDRFSQATRLTDGRLEVQAIAWSPVVEDRMAVINNEIVRQGNSIEGFAVVEIGDDKVLVKEGGQLYVVLFGGR